MAGSTHIHKHFPVFIRRARLAAKFSAIDPSRALDAIIYSAIALEAYPNDFVRWLEMPIRLEPELVPPQLKAAYEIVSDLEEQRVSSRTKYQVLLYALSSRTFDPGAKPFDDFVFLFKLRDELVHPKCGYYHLSKDGMEGPDKLTKKLIAALESRGLIERDADGHRAQQPWTMRLENLVAANWAIDTARAMINAICDAVPVCRYSGSINGVRDPHSSMNAPI